MENQEPKKSVSKKIGKAVAKGAIALTSGVAIGIVIGCATFLALDGFSAANK